MFRSSSLLVGVGLLLCLETNSRAQEATPDQVEVGRKFAAMVCANCHVTAPDKQTTPILNPPAPSFMVLAKQASLTEAYLRQLLTSKHNDLGPRAKMPNPQLADYQINEVIAYFMSLKKRR